MNFGGSSLGSSLTTIHGLSGDALIVPPDVLYRAWTRAGVGHQVHYQVGVPKGICQLYNTHRSTLRDVAESGLTRDLLDPVTVFPSPTARSRCRTFSNFNLGDASARWRQGRPNPFLRWESRPYS